MRTLRYSLAVLVVAVAAMGIVYALESPEKPVASGTTKLAPGQTAAATVTMTDANKFEPDKVKIKVGDTVEWKNTAKVAHTVIDDPKVAQKKGDVERPMGAEMFNSGPIAPGTSWYYTFEMPGTYKYICGPHETVGMKGEVVVKNE
jgi:plastocyanin